MFSRALAPGRDFGIPTSLSRTQSPSQRSCWRNNRCRSTIHKDEILIFQASPYIIHSCPIQTRQAHTPTTTYPETRVSATHPSTRSDAPMSSCPPFSKTADSTPAPLARSVSPTHRAPGKTTPRRAGQRTSTTLGSGRNAPTGRCARCT
jgi:hypothetical protein